VLGKLWEAISPDPMLLPFETDYRWLTQVYVSVQPTSGTGKLVWHALGAKTIELIHQNVHVDAVRDDLETLVLDAELLEASWDPPIRRSAQGVRDEAHRAAAQAHGQPQATAHLSERLEALKERHERGLLNSVEFLKHLLELARDLVSTEKETPPRGGRGSRQGRAHRAVPAGANEKTPVIVERVVADIDEIVRLVRFPGWQTPRPASAR
jgi:type I restriction enzyme R subunit